MKWFFASKELLLRFLQQLSSLQCPRCGAVGCFNRHGLLLGFVSPNQEGIRAWRIYCRPRQGGCGYTPSLRLDSTLPRRYVDAQTIWIFLKLLLKSDSVQAAWDQAHTGLCVDAAYRLLRDLKAQTHSIRTLLLARGPPPNSPAQKSLHLTIQHLKEVFGEGSAIQAFQQKTQQGFP